MGSFSPHARRFLVGTGIVAFVAVLLFVTWKALTILLLVFAGLLVAVYLRGLANLLERHTPLGPGLALAAVVLTHLLLAGLVAWAVPAMEPQVAELRQKLPEGLARLRDWLRDYTWGRALLEEIPSASQVVESSGQWLSRITGVVSSTVTLVVYLFIIAFVGLYGAAEPKVYERGLVALFPPQRRARVREVSKACVHTLRWWLVGRFSSATIIGLLSTIPLPLLLGLLAGVLTFVPNIGPTISVVPPALLALLQSPQKALIVLMYYAVVQFVESYIVTPLIQRRAVHVPPALLLTAQAVLGVLAGILGIAVAAPLMALTLVLTRKLYVEDVLEARDQDQAWARRSSHS